MKLQRVQFILQLLSALCFFPFLVEAQLWFGIISPARAIDWTHAGVPGGIPTNYRQCGPTISAYSGSAERINRALAACRANQFVLLGAGVFHLTTSIEWRKDNVALRGSGSNWNTGTRLVFAPNAHAGGCHGVFADICMSGEHINDSQQNVNVGNWVGGYARGSNSIQLGTQKLGSTKPNFGMTLILDQLTDGTTRAQDNNATFHCTTAPVCTQGGSGAGERSGRAMQQMVVVTSISGGSCKDARPCTVGISPTLYMPDWRGSQSPQAWWADGPYSTGMGLEDLSLDTSVDCASCTGNSEAITLFNVQNSWIKNIHVEIVRPEPVALGNNKHVRLYQSHNITVRDSYFHGRANHDDYGINFWESSDNLIENNIIQGIGTPVNNEGGNGNVIAYNFTVNNNWGTISGCAPDPAPCWAQGSIYNHAASVDYQLVEGNIAYGIETENYFGNSFFNTAFRNRFWGFQTQQIFQTVPVFIYALNRFFNIIGNVLGMNGYHTTYQTVGGADTTNCIHSVYAIGLGGNCSNGDGKTWPLSDTLVANATVSTMMRWGNYDTANATVRFVSAEVPSTTSIYPNPIPGNQNLPASFYYSSKPPWWGAVPWPPIGPDVSGGNVGQCFGGTYNRVDATTSSQCVGGTFASTAYAGHVNAIPAMRCYLEVMGGVPDGSSRGVLAFDGSVCYGEASPAASSQSRASARQWQGSNYSSIRQQGDPNINELGR